MADGKPGKPKGLPKSGGRVKGTPNRVATMAAVKLAKTELTAEVAVEAIRRGALYDPRKFFDEHGNLRPIHKLSEDEAFAIAGFEVIIKNAKAGDGVTDEIHKVKLVNRERFVEMAAKYHNLLKETLDVNVTEVGNRLEAAREAARQRNAARGKDKG